MQLTTEQKQIESLKLQLQKANKTISALEQEVTLLNNQNTYLKRTRKGLKKQGAL